ncbi:MAG: UvrD-helicase domain-containing protein, partial [Planctomycetia bacterium]|nr:UvrD-helicase domain-containing protein [Planctomycetia bacterium]
LTRFRCREILVDVIRSLHRLRVGTLDSLFQEIAGNFASELGLPPGWRIVDQDAAADLRLRTEATRQLLRDPGAAQTLMHRLTRGETSRKIVSQIHETIAQLDSLARESLPQAWNICPEIPPISGEILRRTLDELSDAIEETSDKNFRNAYVKLEGYMKRGQWDELLTDCKIVQRSVAPDSDFRYCRKEIPPPVIEICKTCARHALSMVLTQVRIQTLATRELLDRYREISDPLRAADRIYRFSDIPRRIGESQLRSDSFRFRLDAPIDHLLLDEFQDTSPLQWAILRPIAEQIVTSPTGSFFCVGDRKQAIYGWRGGVAAIFDQVRRDLDTTLDRQRLSSPENAVQRADTRIEQEDLNRCWRCSPVILDVVNRVFATLPRNQVVKDVSMRAADEFTGRFGLHQAAPKNSGLPGYVELIASPEPRKSGKQVTPKGENETIVPFAARRIREFVNQAPEATIGVLMRRNQMVGRMIHALRQLGLDASEEGGNPLTDSPAVEVILALMTLTDHPGDRVAAFHVASSPLGPIVGLNDFRDQEQIRQVTASIRQRLVVEQFGGLLHDWRRQLVPACEKRDASRLDQLVELAMRYDRQLAVDLRSPRSTRLETGLRCDDFVHEVRRIRVESPGAATIRVMTIHQAKGLEFDIVVLAELNGRNGLVGQPPKVLIDLPSPTGDPTGVIRYLPRDILENYEELRPLRHLYENHVQRQTEALSLLYVAMTRAVHALCMIVPPTPQTKSAKETLKRPQSFAGVLLAGLVEDRPIQPEEIVFRTGDLRWFRKAFPGSGGDAGSGDGPDSGENTDECSSVNRKADRTGDHTDIGEIAGRGDMERSLPRPRLLPPDPSNPRYFQVMSPSSLEGELKRSPAVRPEDPENPEEVRPAVESGRSSDYSFPLRIPDAEVDGPCDVDKAENAERKWGAKERTNMEETGGVDRPRVDGKIDRSGVPGIGTSFPSESRSDVDRSAARRYAIHRGTLFHFWLERIGTTPPESWPTTEQELRDFSDQNGVPPGIGH